MLPIEDALSTWTTPQQPIIKDLVIEAGFELVESAIEIQLEDDHEVPYLWIIGQK